MLWCKEAIKHVKQSETKRVGEKEKKQQPIARLFRTHVLSSAMRITIQKRNRSVFPHWCTQRHALLLLGLLLLLLYNGLASPGI